MDIDSAKAVMSRSGWLANQPADFRNALLQRVALRSYGKGEFLYHFGDDPGMMFGIVEGFVLVGFPHPVIGLYHGHLGRPGDWFGEAAALHFVTRRVSIEAVGSVQIVSLPLNGVREMIQEKPAWLLHLSALLLWNHETAIRTALDLLVHDPLARVCARLLTLCGVRYGQDPHADPIELALTQDQLAMMCGLSRKSVHRALNELQRKGFCELRYGEIIVSDPKAVRQLMIDADSHRE